MAVPKFQTLMLPMLEALSDGQVRRVVPEVTDLLAINLGLSDADLAEMLPSGAMPTFENRSRWAAWYLVKAAALDGPKRGYVAITKRGLDLLATNPEKVDIGILSQYPEFEAFRRAKSPADAPTGVVSKPEDEDPEEALFSAYTSWRRTVEADLLERLQSGSYPWQSFEKLVVDLLHEMGYGGSDEDRRRVTKMTGDDGIDGVIDQDRLGLDAVYIQAKNYGPNNKIGRPDLQKFAGSLEGQRASKGVFITTSTFSSDAREYVTRITRRIVLIDGPTLAKYMYDHGIGVRSKRSLDVKGVDEAYFDGES